MRHTLLSPVWPTHVGHHSGHNIMGILYMGVFSSQIIGNGEGLLGLELLI